MEINVNMDTFQAYPGNPETLNMEVFFAFVTCRSKATQRIEDQ